MISSDKGCIPKTVIQVQGKPIVSKKSLKTFDQSQTREVLTVVQVHRVSWIRQRKKSTSEKLLF